MDRHASFFSLVGVLFNSIQFRYGTLSPFSTDNPIITVFFVAVLIHVVGSACEAKLEGAHFKSIAARSSFLARILALVLLITILYPKIGCLLFFSWVLLFIWVAYTLREELLQNRYTMQLCKYSGVFTMQFCKHMRVYTLHLSKQMQVMA
jgi:hypothetical protein